MTQYSWKNDRVEGLLITIIFEHMRNCIFFFMLVLLYQKINLIGFWDAQLLREHIMIFHIGWTNTFNKTKTKMNEPYVVEWVSSVDQGPFLEEQLSFSGDL